MGIYPYIPHVGKVQIFDFVLNISVKIHRNAEKNNILAFFGDDRSRNGTRKNRQYFHFSKPPKIKNRTTQTITRLSTCTPVAQLKISYKKLKGRYALKPLIFLSRNFGVELGRQAKTGRWTKQEKNRKRIFFLFLLGGTNLTWQKRGLLARQKDEHKEQPFIGLQFVKKLKPKTPLKIIACNTSDRIADKS